MQVNKKAYAETLSQFNFTGLHVSFFEPSNTIGIAKRFGVKLPIGYENIGELIRDINETYTALCQPRYNIVISLDSMDEVNAYLAKIGTKGVKVLKEEVEIDLNELTEE